MITIVELNEKDFLLLKEFDSQEWYSADKEHYGDQKLDFTKYKFAFVVHDGEKIIGYISLIFDLGVLYMESLIVSEKYRNQGIATKLVVQAEEKGKSLGAHKIRLETGGDWKAKDFYEKLGYQVRAHLPNYYAKRDFVLMDKDL